MLYLNGLRHPAKNGSTFLGAVVPIVMGAVIAGASALLMGYLTPIWTVLVLAAGITLIGSLVVKDSRLYWLTLFLFVLPLNIYKNFATTESVLSRVYTLGLPWGTTTLFLQLSDLPMIVLLISWIVRMTTKRQALYWPAVNYLPLGFLAWSTLGLLFSLYPSLTLFELIRQYKLFLIYLFTINNVDIPKMGRPIILVLLAGLFIQEGVTIVRYQFQLEETFFGDTFGDASERLVTRGTITGEESDRDRGEGTFGHGNATAMHLEFVLPLALMLFVASPRILGKWLGLIILLLGLGTVYVTFSRGAMVGLVAGLIVCFAVAYARGLVSTTLTVMILSVALLLSPVAVYKLSSFLTTRPEAYEERFVHWEAGVRLIRLNPIIGTGLNTSTAVRRDFGRGLGAPDLIDEDWPIHNHFLIGIIETGVIGATMYLSFFILVGLEALRRSRSKDFDTASLSIAIVSAYAAIALHMTIDILSLDGLHTLLWFYAGLIIALRRTDGDYGYGVAGASGLRERYRDVVRGIR